MKKFLGLIAAIILIYAGYTFFQKQSVQEDEIVTLTEGEIVTVEPLFNVDFDNTIYNYTKDNVKSDCTLKNDILCAVDSTIKCTLNPDLNICDKARMPKFVFMEDESLKRPETMEYAISKVKPISAESVEVYTESTCDGNWFGLCNGNIIYVVNKKENSWVVKDIYAIEQ